MANWERRSALELADALRGHSENTQHGLERRKLFIHLEKDANKAGTTTETDASTLAALREDVCKVCRGDAAYVCDVDSGWSANCALIRQNSLQG